MEYSPLKGNAILHNETPRVVDFAKKKKEFYVSIYSNRTSPVKATNIIDKINNNQILAKPSTKKK